MASDQAAYQTQDITRHLHSRLTEWVHGQPVYLADLIVDYTSYQSLYSKWKGGTQHPPAQDAIRRQDILLGCYSNVERPTHSNTVGQYRKQLPEAIKNTSGDIVFN